MRTFKTILLFFLIHTGLASAQTADEVISKHIQATGGKEKHASMNTLRMTCSMEMGPGMKAPFTLTLINNKCMKMEMSIQGMTMIQCLDGDNGWYIMPFQGKTDPEKMNEDMVKQSKEETDITGPLFNYKEKGNTVDLVGKEEMEGTDVFKLKVTLKNGDIRYIYIDATSYYILKETQKQKMKDKEIESETVFSNFKAVDGIMFPFTLEERPVGESSGQVITVENIEVNPKVDPSIFKMPDAKK